MGVQTIHFMFNIHSNSNTLIDHQIQKEISKPIARELLKKRFTQEEFKATNPWWKRSVGIDSGEALKNSRLYKKNYDRTAPETLSPQAQNEMWKRAKQLKDEFTIGMLSREELHPTKSFLDNGATRFVVDEERMRSNRSVERELMWQKKNADKVAQFKNLMRHLNPDDPHASDIERFRPKMRGIK